MATAAKETEELPFSKDFFVQGARREARKMKFLNALGLILLVCCPTLFLIFIYPEFHEDRIVFFDGKQFHFLPSANIDVDSGPFRPATQAASYQNDFWLLAADGVLLRLENKSWKHIVDGPTAEVPVSVGWDKSGAWAFQSDGSFYRFNGTIWEMKYPPPGEMSQVKKAMSVAPARALVTVSGSIHLGSGSELQEQPLPGQVAERLRGPDAEFWPFPDFSLLPNGNVVMPEGGRKWWIFEGRSWIEVQVPEDFRNLRFLGADGEGFWFLAKDMRVFCWTLENRTFREIPLVLAGVDDLGLDFLVPITARGGELLFVTPTHIIARQDSVWVALHTFATEMPRNIEPENIVWLGENSFVGQFEVARFPMSEVLPRGVRQFLELSFLLIPFGLLLLLHFVFVKWQVARTPRELLARVMTYTEVAHSGHTESMREPGALSESLRGTFLHFGAGFLHFLPVGGAGVLSYYLDEITKFIGLYWPLDEGLTALLGLLLANWAILLPQVRLLKAANRGDYDTALGSLGEPTRALRGPLRALVLCRAGRTAEIFAEVVSYFNNRFAGKSITHGGVVAPGVTQIDDMLRLYALGLVMQDRLKEAEAVLRDSTLVLHGTGWYETPVHLAEVWLLQNKEPALALVLLEQAQALAGKLAKHQFGTTPVSFLYADMAWAHAKSGNLDRANEYERLARKAIQKNNKPEHAAVLLRLAYGKLHEKDFSSLRGLAQEVKELDCFGYSAQAADRLLRATP